MDVAFVGRTAYVMVSLVGDPFFGGTEKDGIYGIDGSGNQLLRETSLDDE